MSATGTRCSENVRELLRGGASVAAGRRLDGDGRSFDVIDPTSEQVLATLPSASGADVGAAVSAARRAFASGPWPEFTPRERSQAIQRLVDRIAARSEEFAEIGALDVGTPITLSRGLHAAAPVGFLQWFADAALRGPRGGYEHSLGQNHVITPTTSSLFYEPVGVVAAIAAYNFPLLITAFKVGGALAAGCTVVLMPSPRAPLAAIAFMRAVEEAEIPPGVVNLVLGEKETGTALSEHPDVDMVSFTGSVDVGREVMVQAAGGLKKVVLELGGKSPNIFLPGADIEAGVPPSVLRFTRNTGQGCGATTRTLVHRDDLDRFVTAARAFIDTLSVGDPLQASTDLGPLIAREHRDRVAAYVERAVDGGGTIVAGGGEPPTATGFFINPAIVGGVAPSAEICQEELFGPIGVVLPYDTVGEAIEIANNTRFGLNANVWGLPAEAMMVARKLKSGTVTINGGGADRPDAPWGGYGHSGIGYDRGEEGFREFFQVKHIQWPI
jgi:aldehyde dehydrogenase (NAD+)/betaine-aldehyde dehydrogenase